MVDLHEVPDYLEVAQPLGVSKQTLLNWLYAPGPRAARNKKGYVRRSREALVKSHRGGGLQADGSP
jgi:hypothetical protein